MRRGVAFFRFTALRVMSRSWRLEAVRLVLLLVVLGVKNLLKRFGVIGGGFLTLWVRTFLVGDEGGGDDAKDCEEEGSWSNTSSWDSGSPMESAIVA